MPAVGARKGDLMTAADPASGRFVGGSIDLPRRRWHHRSPGSSPDEQAVLESSAELQVAQR